MTTIKSIGHTGAVAISAAIVMLCLIILARFVAEALIFLGERLI